MRYKNSKEIFTEKDIITNTATSTLRGKGKGCSRDKLLYVNFGRTTLTVDLS